MLSQEDIQENFLNAAKAAISWILSLQAQDIAIWLSIAYTSVLLFVLVRDKIIRKPRRRPTAETKPGDFDESTR